MADKFLRQLKASLSVGTIIGANSNKQKLLSVDGEAIDLAHDDLVLAKSEQLLAKAEISTAKADEAKAKAEGRRAASEAAAWGLKSSRFSELDLTFASFRKMTPEERRKVAADAEEYIKFINDVTQ